VYRLGWFLALVSKEKKTRPTLKLVVATRSRAGRGREESLNENCGDEYQQTEADGHAERDAKKGGD
jgi:hypothetical protein